MVCYAHGHAEVKAHAKGLERGGQAGHTGHILGYGETGGVDFLDQAGGQGQVDDGILVHAGVKVQAVVHEVLAQAVVPVQHGGDTVKAEAVYVILLHPVLDVGQQEVAGLVFSVVKAAGTPGRMAAGRALVEVQVVRSVKLAQAFRRVFHAVAVHDIHNDGYPLSVGVVHQGFELFGRAKSGAQGKEIGDLVAEGAVVRVLLQGHDLDGIVTQGLDLGKNVFAEFFKRAHFLLLRGHANVALVNERVRALAGVAVFPRVGLGGSPHLGAEDFGYLVLDHAGGIGREALSAAARPLDIEFVQLAVPKEHCGNLEFPVAVSNGLEGIGVCPLPVVAVSYEENLGGVGSKFTEHPAAVLEFVQAVVKMVVHSILEEAVSGNVLKGLPDVLVPGVNGAFVRHEPGVLFVDLFHTLLLVQ